MVVHTEWEAAGLGRMSPQATACELHSLANTFASDNTHTRTHARTDFGSANCSQTLWSNIVLVGGNTLHPGYNDRLNAEMHHVAPPVRRNARVC